MTTGPASDRREFLIDGGRAVAAGWLALQMPFLESLQARARIDAAAGAPWKSFSAAEGRTMRAFAAQIVPAEAELPGAEQAGAVYFIDRAVATSIYAARLPELRAGLADLDERAHKLGAAKGFSALAADQQVVVMKEVEKTPFFTSARMLTIMGTFSDPSHGGNRGGTGWHVAGMEHGSSFQAPFGWYDAPANRDLA